VPPSPRPPPERRVRPRTPIARAPLPRFSPRKFRLDAQGAPANETIVAIDRVRELTWLSPGFRRQYCHAIDIVPTLYECLGVELPEAVNGYAQKPLEGVSFAATLADAGADTGKRTQFYSMLGTRAIWHEGWKAATAVPASPAYWGPFDEQRWELFDTENDPSECHDLADRHPDRLRDLVDRWWAEAKKHQALPLETRTAVEAFMTPRPQPSKPRTRYVYYANGANVPESVTPDIRGRSYTIAAEVEVDTPEAGGVLFSQGSRFGGHALYIRDGRLRYVYNCVGELVQIVESAGGIPTGHVVLSASFAREGTGLPAEGTLSLHIRDRRVGQAHIRTQPGKFGLGGGGLVVGRSGGEPVADDYPGQAPWPFVGGVVKRVLVDVSGDPFADLAREAAALYARQ